MSIDNLKQAMPEYAKDIKLNLSSIVNDPGGMSGQQLWGTILVSAIASRNQAVIREVSEEASSHLSEEAVNSAKAAAAIMAMNNVYYRFVHFASEKEYGTMPPKLRMNIMAKPGVEKVDFELWSLAVSAINGCGMCMDSHEKTLAKHDVSRDVIQNAIRIASVIHAAAVTLDTGQTGN